MAPVECCFLEYVPSALADLSFSIAVIFIDHSAPDTGLCSMSVRMDWRVKLRLIDPYCDLQMLEALLKEIEVRLRSKGHRMEVLRQMEDSFSNILQLSKWRKCPATILREDTDNFARGLFETPSQVSASLSSSGRLYS
jgi:hypothetical protein